MIYWRSGRHAPPSSSVTAEVLIRVTMLLLSAGTGLVWAYSEQHYFSFQAVHFTEWGISCQGQSSVLFQRFS